MKELINVLIKDDHQRIVNWDYDANRTLAYVLGQHQFKPIAGTVRVCGCQVEEDLSSVKLADCPMKIAPNGKQLRVEITLQSMTERKASKLGKDSDKVIPFTRYK